MRTRENIIGEKICFRIYFFFFFGNGEFQVNLGGINIVLYTGACLKRIS